MSCQGNHVKTSDILIDSKAPVNAVATVSISQLFLTEPFPHEWEAVHLQYHYNAVDNSNVFLEITAMVWHCFPLIGKQQHSCS